MLNGSTNTTQRFAKLKDSKTDVIFRAIVKFLPPPFTSRKTGPPRSSTYRCPVWYGEAWWTTKFVWTSPLRFGAFYLADATTLVDDPDRFIVVGQKYCLTENGRQATAVLKVLEKADGYRRVHGVR